jgi:hypothetical protein
MSTTIIRGMSIADVFYGTDESILGVSIVWNVTRIARDAKRGRFGPPQVIPISTLPPVTPAMAANVDWRKVQGMLGRHVAHPNDSPLDIPALQVLVNIREQPHRLLIDGNHRVSARRVCGYPDFAFYLVPIELEGRYRITEETIRGG